LVVSVDFEDYYSVLGVDRDASQEDIQKAYKRLARKYHPDVNDEPDAEEKFKQLNEAYQVLKDPEKRKKYDHLGQNWDKAAGAGPGGGQTPPGWENVRVNMGGGGPGGQDMNFEDIFGGAAGSAGKGSAGGFSDFFETFFGQGMHGGGPGGAGGGGARARQRQRKEGRTHRASLEVTLEDVYYGREKTIVLPIERVEQGRRIQDRKTYTVQIPPGTTEGSTIRLAGGGEEGRAGGRRGDILIEIEIAEHPTFEVDGLDLRTEVAVTPWEAALGAKVDVPTVEGSAKVTVPEGAQSGSKLRLKGKGLPKNANERGNLYAELSIRIPDELSERERELFEQLRDSSSFAPRD
jgi:curved DNA-binding protein